MRCPRCENEIADDEQSCAACGEPVGATSGSDDASDPTDPLPPPAFGTIPTVPAGETDALTDHDDVTGMAVVGDPTDLPTEPVATTNAPTEQVDAVETTPPITTQFDAIDSPAPEITSPQPFTISTSDEHAEVFGVPGPATPPTAELPSLFDGSGDIEQFPEPRAPFQVRLIFLFSLFGVGAMLMTIVADVIDIRTSRPVPGIVSGQRLLDDLGSNLGIGGLVGTAVLVLGAFLSCFGLRWGGGLAGGAGLALVGWAALTIGLAELPIALAESITRTSTAPEPFTLRVTRDLGWWLIVGVGAVGLLTFLGSLRWIGNGGRAALNPMIAALTAVAAVVLGFGPLVPVGDASISDNFRSADPLRDLPTAFFAGRLTQVGLIAIAGVIGLLIVRSYGLGLAAGGVSVAVWMWASSFAELGARPVGIADRNPGAQSTVPHAVTTVGMIATLALLSIAAIWAIFRLRRPVRRPA